MMRWARDVELAALVCLTSLAMVVPAAAQSFHLKPELAVATTSMPVWQSEGEPVSEDDYWEMFQGARWLARRWRGVKSLSADAQSALVQMADRLESVKAVQLASGEIVPVDNSELAAAFRETNPDLASVDKRVTALMEAHRNLPRVSPDPSAMGKLSAVLARSEFQPQGARLPAWLEEWRQRFDDWLARQLARIGLGEVHLPNLNWLITAAGVLVLGAVAFFFIRSLRANLAAEADLEDIINGPRINSSAALAQAQQLAANADYRSAVRFLYLSAVLSLDERGLLHFDKALTNREVLRRTSHERLRGELAPIVETFDKVWYGFVPISDEQYHEYELQVERAREVKPG